jgi:alanyl-tRNA synthetase
MTSKEIRQSFFDFFASKQHTIVPSSPVVLPADPTLLFTNAGMNQFKEIFLGAREAGDKRVANTQKCIRVSGKHNDLEEVGHDTYHHTFFEMLGNWSFGDYYKKEAIEWAWELMTEVWKLDKARIWATVYRTDDEALELWKELTDIDPDHILQFDEKDNFWEMGETGPCGPCSEIHYDLTPEGNASGDMVNADLPEVIEIWNLVFMQYNRRSDGSLEELTAKHVDTGMGFERISAVLQGKSSNYDTDVFMPLIEKIADMSGRAYEGEDAIAMRVCADHIRTLSFAIGDGILPSNDGRGYVLRRLLRRAVRYGRNLGFEKPFLCELFPTLEEQLKEMFPELEKQRDSIIRALRSEEESFSKTLDRGIALFDDVAAKLDEGDIFPGHDAFKLYDTFGFPFDLTALMAAEKGLKVDEAQFSKLMDEQRERARSARSTGDQNAEMDLIADLVAQGVSSAFVGYETTQCETEILEVLDSGAILLKDTPFYPESGGQQGDHGAIKGAGFDFEVTDTQKPAEGIILHTGRLVFGEIKKGDRALAAVDRYRRGQIRRNHTSTHLLNQALRQIVDPSIKQAGSMVASDYLRFDFNYFEAIKPDQLRAIERVVNHEIMRNTPLQTLEMSLADVQQSGEIQAVFDDKYGETVRVVAIGEFSKELCGGTHVQATGDIGQFRILSESSVAAGIRRIEAVTGMEALAWTAEEHELLSGISQRLSVKPGDLPERIKNMADQAKAAEKQLKDARMKAAVHGIEALLSKVETLSLHDKVDNMPLLAATAGEVPMDALRELMDRLRQKLESGVILLGSHADGKACFMASVSEDLVGEGIHAGKLIGAVAKLAGGGGGGRPDKAQAGGKDGSKVADAIKAVPGILKDMHT